MSNLSIFQKANEARKSTQAVVTAIANTNYQNLMNRARAIVRLANAGTSEGVKKGWETRKHGVGDWVVHPVTGKRGVVDHIYSDPDVDPKPNAKGRLVQVDYGNGKANHREGDIKPSQDQQSKWREKPTESSPVKKESWSTPGITSGSHPHTPEQIKSNIGELNKNIERYGKIPADLQSDRGYKSMVAGDVAALKAVAGHYQRGDFKSVASVLGKRDSAVADEVPKAILKHAGYSVRNTRTSVRGLDAFTNSDGSFKPVNGSKFEGCVVTMKSEGHSDDSAHRICGEIAQSKVGNTCFGSELPQILNSIGNPNGNGAASVGNFGAVPPTDLPPKAGDKDMPGEQKAVETLTSNAERASLSAEASGSPDAHEAAANAHTEAAAAATKVGVPDAASTHTSKAAAHKDKAQAARVAAPQNG